MRRVAVRPVLSASEWVREQSVKRTAPPRARGSTMTQNPTRTYKVINPAPLFAPDRDITFSTAAPAGSVGFIRSTGPAC
ncbi:hypothetical protein GCM10011579_016750 [Streptomyces albiflavescens]|uniref:Uncharacterized protein n=1 Tax=Streptomyces albiflavescens TaxID=1623582 RepID=A0A917XVZ7_9ACTN|nr:hypothetical protein GCM10011579_016750 [Streptomyces albiflavescens]